jgi:hypothetical protein
MGYVEKVACFVLLKSSINHPYDGNALMLEFLKKPCFEKPLFSVFGFRETAVNRGFRFSSKEGKNA